MATTGHEDAAKVKRSDWVLGLAAGLTLHTRVCQWRYNPPPIMLGWNHDLVLGKLGRPDLSPELPHVSSSAAVLADHAIQPAAVQKEARKLGRKAIWTSLPSATADGTVPGGS